MNKKIIISILAVLLVFSVVLLAACANDNSGASEDSGKTTISENESNGNSENTTPVEINDATDVINNVFATYKEDQKFASMGGTFEAPVDGKAGLMDVSDKETINGMLHTTDELLDKTDEVASLVHAMNANTFTSGSFKLKDADTADAFCSELKDSVLATKWMCGFPEKFVAFSINDGEYVVYAVGNGQAIDYFKTQLTAVMGKQAVLVTEEEIKV